MTKRGSEELKDSIDYYAVLGIAQTAPNEKVRARYRALVKRYHPDLAPGDKVVAAGNFRLVRQAYDVLSNPKRRAQYDQERQKRIDQETRLQSPTEAAGNPSDASKMFVRAWQEACRLHPHLEGLHAELAKIAAPLGISFQRMMLASREFDKALILAAKLKENFFVRYLDTDPQLLHFPQWIQDIETPDKDPDEKH